VNRDSFFDHDQEQVDRIEREEEEWTARAFFPNLSKSVRPRESDEAHPSFRGGSTDAALPAARVAKRSSLAPPAALRVVSGGDPTAPESKDDERQGTLPGMATE